MKKHRHVTFADLARQRHVLAGDVVVEAQRDDAALDVLELRHASQQLDVLLCDRNELIGRLCVGFDIFEACIVMRSAR